MVLVDCGVKHNIIRCLTRRGVKVVRVPWNYDFTTIPYDGLFISNGPGNPDMAEATVANIRKAMEIGHKSKPYFSAQFHPEASSGPKDTEFLFDEFINML